LLGTAGLLRWYLLVARSQKIAGEKPVGGGRSFKTKQTVASARNSSARL